MECAATDSADTDNNILFSPDRHINVSVEFKGKAGLLENGINHRPLLTMRVRVFTCSGRFFFFFHHDRFRRSSIGIDEAYTAYVPKLYVT